uniref:Uncharacterized protein n=1 Tax=Plectus sambesii TaxID=2011161 RepID=A0A914XAD1_9BILA
MEARKLWSVCLVLGACLLLTAQAAEMGIDRRGDDGLDSILAELKGKAMSGRMRFGKRGYNPFATYWRMAQAGDDDQADAKSVPLRRSDPTKFLWSQSLGR